MWTVQRMTENAVPSPNWFSLPHLPSHLKNQIPPSLFPLLSHPLSQTWIMNAPALRCFDSPIFKTWSHMFIYFCSPVAGCVYQPQWVPRLFQWKSHSSSQETVWLVYWNTSCCYQLSFIFLRSRQKKNSCSMHLLNLSTTFQRPSLVKLCLLLIPHFYQQRLTFLADPVKQHCFRGRLSTEMDFLA